MIALLISAVQDDQQPDTADLDEPLHDHEAAGREQTQLDNARTRPRTSMRAAVHHSAISIVAGLHRPRKVCSITQC